MATVIHPDTKEIRPSVNTPEYTAKGWVVVPESSRAALEAEPAHYRVIEDGMPRVATQAERDAADNARLPKVKAQKVAEIQVRTDELIEQGFIYGGKVLSLSEKAKTRWIGLVVGAAALQYPYPVPTLDGLDAYSLSGPSDVQGLYAAAMGTVATHIGSGTALQQQVAAATTVAEVNAIEDQR